MELTKVGKTIANATFSPFLIFSCVAVMYFVLCYPVSWYAKHLERKIHGHR
jgi:polar amino acid transport system permease protein